MAVLDWLQQLLGGGDPEAAGAAQASTAMQPMTQQWLDKVLSGEMARSGIQDANDAFASRDPVALAGSFGPSPLGIRAFHGSPHSFDRFDLGKIGTGEGAQAYGHGLYFAESEPVARQYRNAVKDNSAISALNDQMSGVSKEIDKLGQLPGSREWADPRWPEYDRLKAEYDRLMQQREATVSAPGHMYEVDINAKPEDFLQWDKPLGEQPPHVLAALEPGMAPHLAPLIAGTAMRQAAESPYAAGLVFNKGRGPLPASPADVSQRLQDMGIPGNRYLDQGSRAAGEGSSNYAIWTPEIITIMRRFGLLPPLAAGGLLAAPGPGEAAQP